MKGSKKKSIFESLLSPFDEFEKLFENMGFEGFQGGYSIEVVQSGGKTTVKARVGRDVSAKELRRELEKQYPGAEIIIEGGKPSIEEVGREEREGLHEGEVRTSSGSAMNLSGPRTRRPRIEEIKD